METKQIIVKGTGKLGKRLNKISQNIKNKHK